MVPSAQIMEVFSSVQGEGILVGERQLFVRFYGCNTSCTYCDTEASKGPIANCRVETAPATGEFQEHPNPIEAGKLSQIIGELNSPPGLHHSLVLTGGEPLLHSGFLSSFLPMLKQEMPVFLETNGLLYEKLSEIVSWVEMISMDVKLASATGRDTDWNAHRNFLETCRGKDVSVKAVLAPQVEPEEVDLLIDLMVKIDPTIPLVLQPLHGTEGAEAWGRRLLQIQARCKSQLRWVRVIPQMHKVLNIS